MYKVFEVWKWRVTLKIMRQPEGVTWIRFNPEGKEFLSHHEMAYPAMKIATQDNADQYLTDYAQHLLKNEEVENPYAEAKSKILALSELFPITVRTRVAGLFSNEVSKSNV